MFLVRYRAVLQVESETLWDEAGFGQEGSKTKVKITSYSNTLNTIIFDSTHLLSRLVSNIACKKILHIPPLSPLTHTHTAPQSYSSQTL